MPRPTLPALLLALLTSACSGGDLCSQAPRCDGSEALNCEPACTVGPCSSGPIAQECAGDTTCTVVPGDRNDARFYRSRAVCAKELTACNPAEAAPPVCEEGRFAVGCSAYRRVIRVPCSQSGLYFAQAPACCSGVDGDAGTPDGGTADGGVPDGGASGGDGGR